MTAPALLDVAVPMYAAGASHPYKAACGWIMTEITAGRLEVVINTETIQEALHRHGSLKRHAEAVNVANDLLAIIPRVLPIEVPDVQRAVTLFQLYAPKGVPSRDLVHAAVMHNNGLTTLLSPDAHFDQIAGITRLDPLVLYQQAGSP